MPIRSLQASSWLDKILFWISRNWVENPRFQKVPFFARLAQRLLAQHVLGFGLKPRDRAYRFNVLAPMLKLRLPSGEDLVEAWQHAFTTGETNKLLTEIANYLVVVNKAKNISASERLARLEMAAAYIGPNLEFVYFRFRRHGQIPQHEAQSQLIESCQHATEALIYGLVVLANNDYCQPNYRYAKVRSRFLQVCHWVIELINLLQHLYALQYRQMPHKYLTIADRMFYSLSTYETTQTSLPLQVPSGLNLASGLPEVDTFSRQSATFHEIYLQVKLLAKVDLARWQPSQLHFLTQLFHDYSAWVTVYPYTGELKPNQHLFTITKELEILSQKSAPDEQPQFVLDCTSLIQALTNQRTHADAVTHSGQEIPPPWSRCNSWELQQSLNDLLEDFTRNTPIDAHPPVRKDPDLHVFLNFPSVFALMDGHQTMPLARFKDEFQLQLVLSMVSCILSNIEEGQEFDDINLWHVADQPTAQDDLYLRISMGTATKPFKLGSLIGFTRPPDYAFKIGLVVRIVRQESAFVTFAVRILSNTCQAVHVQRHMNIAETLHMLIYRHNQGTFCLYPNTVSYHPVLRQHDVVHIPLKETFKHMTLGAMTYIGPEIIVRKIGATKER